MTKVNKDHCLSCALSYAYNEWVAVNGRCPPDVLLRMTASFFSAVIELNDPDLVAAMVEARSVDLMREAAVSIKH